MEIIYSEKSLKNLKLKPTPQHRIYKFQLQDYSWVNLRNQIRNEKDLLKQLIRFQPLNVFSSVSAWLNPLKVEHPEMLKDRILLNSLIYIDIDSHKKSVLKQVRHTINSLGIAEEWDYGNSGNGFYAYYILNDKIAPRIQNIKDRYEFLKGVKEFIVGELNEVDVPICVDMERVSRVIGTYNEGKKLCHSLKGRLNSFKEPKVEKETPSRQVPGKLYSFKFVSNVIEGTNNLYIPILSFKGKRIPNFEELQKKFKLSAFYIFETFNSTIAINLRAVDKRRLLKIMRYAKSSNLSEFEKTGHVWIRTSSLITDKRVKDRKPRLVKVLDTYDHLRYAHSKPHLDLLKHFGLDVFCPYVVGKEKNQVYQAQYKGF